MSDLPISSSLCPCPIVHPTWVSSWARLFPFATCSLAPHSASSDSLFAGLLFPCTSSRLWVLHSSVKSFTVVHFATQSSLYGHSFITVSPHPQSLSPYLTVPPYLQSLLAYSPCLLTVPRALLTVSPCLQSLPRYSPSRLAYSLSLLTVPASLQSLLTLSPYSHSYKSPLASLCAVSWCLSFALSLINSVWMLTSTFFNKYIADSM
jgi:hypothetical protein